MNFQPQDEDLISQIVARAIDIQAQTMAQILAVAMSSARREIVAQVRAEFRGEQCYIGKQSGVERGERDTAIRADRADGLSIRALAKKYHLSKSQVQRVLGGTVEDETN